MGTVKDSLRFNFDLFGLALFIRVRSRAWLYLVPLPAQQPRFPFSPSFSLGLILRHFCY
jgi:hypothetical protein